MDFKEQLGQLNASLNHSINFVLNKLADFPGLSLGEQISYPAIGIGFILIIISAVMFII